MNGHGKNIIILLKLIVKKNLYVPGTDQEDFYFENMPSMTASLFPLIKDNKIELLQWRKDNSSIAYDALEP